ncbi:MAG: hypothetical protein H0V25_08570 [Solirubrobacterales bacterium]|nr:hypothetical protein [Solirubrobacterales bacterium]
MGFLTKLLLGDGRLKPELRAALESEGLVLLEEGLAGRIGYSRFKAPGRRHNGKVTGVRAGLGLSELRLVVYCRSGKSKLIDTRFADSRFSRLDVFVEGDDTLAIRVDYDRMDIPKVSGQITIRAKTRRAAEIVDEVRARRGG